VLGRVRCLGGRGQVRRGAAVTELELELLLLGIEDYTGLWDAKLAARAALPGLTEHQSIDVARSLLTGFLQTGLIELFRVVGTTASGDITQVPLAEVEYVLIDPHWWNGPDAPLAESAWYAATPAGEAAFFASHATR
jgi:hypothetical protein